MKRIFTWNVARKLLIGTVALVTLIALTWAVENFRGKRAWENYRAELEAKGEQLDLEAFIPPQVPDEKNFAMAPFFADLKYDSTGGSTAAPVISPAMKLDPFLSKDGSGAPAIEGYVDLKVLQEFYRGNTNYPQPKKEQDPAKDVLVALSRFDGDIEGLQKAAAERPLARFPIKYENRLAALLPHLAPLRHLASTLWFRSAAHLELGQPDEAFQNVQLSFRVADTLKEEPLIVSHLVRMAVYQINLKMIKEGLVRHAWRESDLQAFEKMLGETDLLAAYERAMRGERAVFVNAFHIIRKSNPDLRGTASEPLMPTLSFVPSGWLYQNQKTLAQLHQDYSLAAVDAEKQRVYPDIAKGGSKVKPTRHPYRMLAEIAFPAVTKTTKRTAESQNSINQALLACGLERYYLRHGNYPERLEDLVPNVVNTLPKDVITGAPFAYERSGNFYTLAAAGWEANGGNADSQRYASATESGVWKLQ